MDMHPSAHQPKPTHQLKDLQSIAPLFHLRKLEFLSLQSTPVSQVGQYRSWLAHHIPSLRYLDFSKVKQQEREAARKLFLEDDGATPTQLAQTMYGGGQTANGAHAPAHKQAAAKTFEVGGGEASGGAGRGLTEEQKQRVRKAIENAGTLEEIQRLKRMLLDGFVPDEKTLKALGGGGGAK